MDGQDYSLTINNGPNNIHGGVTGFSRRLWQSSIDGNVLKMTYNSPDGEDGFPGDVNVTVTYELSEDGSLTLEYTATSSKPCPINLTNHVYLNLSGHNSDDVFDHVAQITADTYVPVNNDLIPTGELSPVADTAVDLRQPTRLRERELAIRRGDLDVTYCVGQNGTLKLVSRISHPESGRFIDTFTTEPGLQFYTAKYMADAVGKGNKQYQPFASAIFRILSLDPERHTAKKQSIHLAWSNEFKMSDAFPVVFVLAEPKAYV
ncbi:GALM-like protein, partial [Mya arenaria]